MRASIGDVQVRNKGTIGGSVAHSDPAGDWPAAVLALDAELVLVGPNGERTVKAEDFFVDLLTTDLQPGEILREIRIKKPSADDLVRLIRKFHIQLPVLQSSASRFISC